MKRTLFLLALLAAAAVPAAQQRGGAAQAPKLDVDPLWPKPFRSQNTGFSAR
jgi:hypothetical protein